MEKPLVLLGLFACAATFLLQGYAFIEANSQTFDEAAHIAAGYSYITTGDFRLNVEHPPLSKELAGLAVYFRFHLPFDPKPELWEKADEWMIGRDFLYHSSVPAEEILRVARWPNLFLGAALVALVGWWTYRLWGGWPAFLAGGLAAFDPNLIAHSGLVTTDLPITFFIFLTMYLLWEYQLHPSAARLLAVGIAAGLTLATKFTGLLVFVIIAVLILLQVLGQRKKDERLESRLRQSFAPWLRMFLIALLVVALLYCVYGFPVWAQGLRYQMARAEAGDPHFYFLGEISSHGSLAYLPLAFFIKTPVATLVMIAASLLLWRSGAALDRQTALFLVVPPALYFAAMAATRVNLGLRYVLPAYPFLFVLAGRAGTISLGKSLALSRGLDLVALALTAASSLSVAPHQLAYFNRIVGGPTKGHWYLSDSNLDWGQDIKGLKSFMDQEKVPVVYLSYFGTAPPAGWGIRYQFLPAYVENIQEPDLKERVPISGTRQILAVSVVNLQGIYFNKQPDRYRWLESRTPLAIIGHSIYVYDVTHDADAHRHLAEIYAEAGFQDFAESEREKVRAMDGK
jgi:Dolichyl-phosphate-mannose-protein mannosyltransferase